MSFKITLDRARWASDVRRLMKLTDKSMEEVLRGQAHLFARDAMRFTPPFGDAPMQEAFPVQKKAGEGAIMHDILGGGTKAWSNKRPGIFVVLPNDMVAKTESRQSLYNSRDREGSVVKVRGAPEFLVTAQKDGTILGADIETWRVKASLQELLDHHAKFRSKRTGRVTMAGSGDKTVGRWKFIDKWVISQTQFNKLRKYLFDRVGLAKSGWVKAIISTLSGKGGSAREGIPAWIWRHRRGIDAGVFAKTGRDEKVQFLIGNAIPYVQRFAEHIESRAWKNRLRNFPKQVEQTARAIARKAKTV